jgi:MFS family permease
LASNLGTLMQSVGAAWLMGDLGASPAMVALVQTATFLPVFLVGIPAGVLADLFDRRRLLLGTQMAMMATAFTLAALTFTDIVTPAGVLALTFALGAGAALNGPAWMSIQPDLVPKHQFGQAVALGSMTFNVGRAVGPAIGGLIVAAAGPQWVFALNGVSFVGTLLVLWRWRSSRDPSAFPPETFTGATRAGLRYGANSPLVRAVLIRVAAIVLPGSAIPALLPIVVRGPLGLGSGGYGLLLGCFGAGAATAAVVRPRVARWLHPDAILGVSAVVLAGTLLVQGYVGQPWVVGLTLLAGGFWWSLTTTATTVVAQAALPAWVRARGMSLYTLVLTGSVAVGAAVAGLLATANLSRAHLVAAVAMLASPIAARRWPLTWPRDYDLTMLPGDEPLVALAPAPEDGPVLVTVTYRVPNDDMDRFATTMRYVERHRRRTGAYRWGLFRDLAEPDRFVETFVVSSWAEHLRQHHRRTETSDQLLDEIRPYLDPAGGVSHLISSYSESGLTRLDGAATTERFDEEV